MFMAAEAADFKATYDCKSSQKKRFAQRLILAAADAFQQTTNALAENGRLTKENYYQLATCLLFRTGMALSAPGDKPEVCEKKGTWANGAGAIFITTAEAITHRDRIANCVNAIIRGISPTSVSEVVERYRAQEFIRIRDHLNNSPVLPFHNEQEEQAFLDELRHSRSGLFLCPISGRFIHHPIRNRERPDIVVERESLEAARNRHQHDVVINNETFSLDSFEEAPIPDEEEFRGGAYEQFRRLHSLEQEIRAGYQALAHPETLQRIPRMIWEHPKFRHFHCAITHEPIRFIVSPENHFSTCYEQERLRTWLHETPHQLPPEWPEGVPFDENHLQISAAFQAIRERTLHDLAAEIRAQNLLQA